MLQWAACGVSRTWWIGVLFAIGSTCFARGRAPGYLSLVGAEADGITFFVGRSSSRRRRSCSSIDAVVAGSRADRWASGIQFVGTLLFNRTTFRALSTSLDERAYDHLVWAPDIYGCICFLVASQIRVCWTSGRPRPSTCSTSPARWPSRRRASCSYVAPGTDTVRNMTLVNVGTCVGALCFLAGAILLLPKQGQAAYGEVS